MNQQFAVIHDKSKRTLIDDFGGMIIRNQIHFTEVDPSIPKWIELPQLGLKINSYSCLVHAQDKRLRILKKIESDDNMRERPVYTQKNLAREFIINPKLE